MKQQKNLINLIYGYITFAFVGIVLEIFDILSPLPGVLACLWLLTACYYIGKYSKS